MSILNRNVKIWHLVLAVVVGASLFGGGFVMAAAPATFFPSGAVRLSSAFVSQENAVGLGSNETDRVIRTSVTVPAGKKANIQATFSAMIQPDKSGTNFAYCYAEFTLDSATSDAAFAPGLTQMIGGEHAEMPDQIHIAVTGFRAGVGPGTHQVNVYVTGSFNGCTVNERTLNVIATIN